MIYEKISGLIEGIIESEFGNVQDFREKDFTDSDKEQRAYNCKTIESYNNLKNNLSEENKSLLDDFEVAIIDEWVNMCKFYFKEGVGAGLTNLKFLNDIESVGSYIR